MTGCTMCSWGRAPVSLYRPRQLSHGMNAVSALAGAAFGVAGGEKRAAL